jgi:predicted enzyme related to lactoylglutathione lyase
MPRINHFAIPAENPERAIQFYREVFGWRFEVGWEYDTPGGRETYWHVYTGDGAGIDGGLTKREYPEQPISVGIEVPDVDEYAALIQRGGGKVLVGKTELPGVAWFAFCQDPEGNTFAIYQPVPGARGGADQPSRP